MSFQVIKDFEQEIAKFFGAPYAVATDCCTHGVELSLRYTKATEINVPKRTYLSICLLYTSPSPRDRTRSRMPSSA